ncbi:pilus assembly protein PilP [Ectothiorhodospiraceae bacterium BW-2]|nr:pilus assembly protein PilP [Ectothiorhodospiraceae bacterium BW-2]
MRSLRLLFVSSLLALSVGCSEENIAPLQAYIAEVKTRPAQGIEPIKEFKNYQSYAYSVAHLRSPFVSDMQPLESELPQQQSANDEPIYGGPKPDFNRRKEALEGFPLDTLRYVGSLEQGEQLWAIIVSPDELVHRVQQGNYLGQNYGKIVAITETDLAVSELIPDGNGGWIERQAGLSLAE